MWLLHCKGQRYAGLRSHLALITLHGLFNSSLSLKCQWCETIRSMTFCIVLGCSCSYCLFPAPQVVCLAVKCPTDEADKAWQQLSNLGIWMGSILQVHSAWLVRGVLLINVLLYYVGLSKWLSTDPVFCLQAELYTPRYVFCLDIWPQQCRRTQTWAFKAYSRLSDLVGLFKWVMQARVEEKKQQDSKLCLEVLQILSFLLNSDGGLVCRMLAVILLFVPDKELRPSLFTSFKRIFSL